jgi:hypothetical protein
MHPVLARAKPGRLRKELNDFERRSRISAEKRTNFVSLSANYL